jgi:flavin reductase (DIM6/NTAB) family NADH-FMN oxidoreductase RutF
MNIDPESISAGRMYRWMVGLITPRPIAWVSTQDDQGVCNLAPYSFFNGVGANPPTVMFCPANRSDGTPKDSHANVLRTGEFVVNIVTEDLADAMNKTSQELRPDEDEFEWAGLAKATSKIVKPPRVAVAAAAMECVLHSAITLGSGPGGSNLIIGRIVHLHVANQYIDEQYVNEQVLDADRLHTVGRMGGADYCRTTDRFRLDRPK